MSRRSDIEEQVEQFENFWLRTNCDWTFEEAVKAYQADKAIDKAVENAQVLMELSKAVKQYPNTLYQLGK